MAPGPFVQAEGTRFMIGGEPFAFVGANVAVLHGAAPRAQLDRTLDAVAADGSSVVRVWALGEAAADGEPWRRERAFRMGPEGWVEETFAHLDRVIASAQQRGLRVVLVLANRWGDYGGFSEYARWAGRAPEAENLSAGELTEFLSCASCAIAYREHVRRVIGRTNTITGVAYADDPTILSWELVNEVSASTAAGERALIEWVAAQSAFVRALDPNHLIAAGHIGYRTERQCRVWTRVHQLEHIGYVDSHAYPLRDPRVRSLRDLRRWVDDRLQLAQHVIGKPFVWGEFGFTTAQRRIRGHARARWVRVFLEQSRRDGAAGALIWLYRTGDSQSRFALRAELPRQARDVRAELRRHAQIVDRRAPTEQNPRLDAGRGEAPLFDRRQVIRGVASRHGTWTTPRERQVRLDVPVSAFARVRAENAGVHRGEVAHVWAAGESDVDYRIRLPSRRSANLVVIEAILSSEVPGGDGGNGDDASVTLFWNDIELATQRVVPDDGRGEVARWTVEDAAVIRQLLRGPRAVRLRFHASSARAGGLCLYGASPLRVFLEE